MTKFHSTKCKVGDEVFDSRKEAERYIELRNLEKGGYIHGLCRQVPYYLIPSQKDDKGKVIEHGVKYIADFVYYEGDRLIVEDVKGVKTREYILKRKLMLYLKGIRIREV